MSDNLPDIPPPPGGGETEAGNDLFAEVLENNNCPFCHVPFEESKDDQWLRTYDGRELWMVGVLTLVCPSCESTLYPEETMELFERARAGEIPNLKSRVYEPEEEDEEQDE